MVGMENGIFPSLGDIEKEDQMEESRRLCYVAITRAKESLYMTSAQVRRVFGRTVSYSQSDFIDEISSSLREYVNERGVSETLNNNQLRNTTKVNNPHSLRDSLYGNRPNDKKTTAMSQAKEKVIDSNGIKLGSKVKHKVFGVGTVVSIVPSGDDKKLTIAFDKQGVKVLLLSFANLELV